MILRRMIEHVKAQNWTGSRRHRVRNAAQGAALQTRDPWRPSYCRRDIGKSALWIPDLRSITACCSASGMTDERGA